MMQYLTFFSIMCALLGCHFQSDLNYNPYKTEITIEKTSHHGGVFCVVYCSSRIKSFDNVAEFIIDDISKENLAIVDNKCIDKEQKQCLYDYCACNPPLNAFRVNFTLSSLNVGQVFGCQMRFLDEETADVFKIFISRRFNGSDFTPEEYDIKIIHKERNVINNGTHLPDSEDRLNDQLVFILAAISIAGFLIAILVTLGIRTYRNSKQSNLNPDDVELPGPHNYCTTCGSMAIWGFCCSCNYFFCVTCSDFHVLKNSDHRIVKIKENDIYPGKAVICSKCKTSKSHRVCVICFKLLCKNCNCLHSNVPINVKLLQQNITKTHAYHDKTGLMNISELKANIDVHSSYSFHNVKIGGLSIFDRNKVIAVDPKNEKFMIKAPEIEISDHQIGYQPRAMVQTSFCEVAISCSYKKIIEIFIFSGNEWRLKRTIDMQVFGEPFNIAYNEEHFVVEIGDFDSGFLVVIDDSNKEIARINESEDMISFIGHSIRLALDMKSTHIFIAAAERMYVSCIDFKGNIQWIIPIPTPSDLIYVPQLMSYGRTILLASKKTDTIYFVSASNGCFENLISFNDPRYIAYDFNDNMLAVCNKAGSINVYEFEKTSDVGELQLEDLSIDILPNVC